MIILRAWSQEGITKIGQGNSKGSEEHRRALYVYGSLLNKVEYFLDIFCGSIVMLDEK